jgi:hypothetical protein
MATVGTLLMVTLLPMKYIPFDPSALKCKKNSKLKAKKSNIMERNLYEDDSHGCDREWANINELSNLLDSNALRSLDPELLNKVGATSPSGSPHLGIPS